MKSLVEVQVQVPSCIFLAVVALTLQGCQESEMNKNCPAWYDPFITDFKPDITELNEVAGCIDEWDFLWGNPCASDVPIPWAKKGTYEHSDLEWILSNAQNGYGYCIDHNISSEYAANTPCMHWTFGKWGCEYETFEECSCSEVSSNGAYCSKWYCLSKEVEQTACWEANWDSTWSAYCPPAGDWPFQLNRSTFLDLLDWQCSKMKRTPCNISSFKPTDILDQDFYDVTMGQCFVEKGVEDEATFKKISGSSTCKDNGWRISLNSLSNCSCGRARSDNQACEAWECDSTDQSRERKIKSRHVCLEAQPSRGVEKLGPGVQCGAWHSDRATFRSAEIGECRACTGSNCGDSIWWGCTFYGQNRIEEFVEQSGMQRWGYRFTHTFLHCSLIGMGQFIVSMALAMAVNEQSDCGGACWMSVAALVCFYGPVMMFTYFLYFVRYKRDPALHGFQYVRADWQTPHGPLAGLVFVVIMSWLTTTAVAIRKFSRGESSHEGVQFMAGCLGVMMMMFLCYAYASGMIVALIPLCLFGCCGCVACSEKTDQWGGSMSTYNGRSRSGSLLFSQPKNSYSGFADDNMHGEITIGTPISARISAVRRSSEPTPQQAEQYGGAAVDPYAAEKSLIHAVDKNADRSPFTFAHCKSDPGLLQAGSTSPYDNITYNNVQASSDATTSSPDLSPPTLGGDDSVHTGPIGGVRASSQQLDPAPSAQVDEGEPTYDSMPGTIKEEAALKQEETQEEALQAAVKEDPPEEVQQSVVKEEEPLEEAQQAVVKEEESPEEKAPEEAQQAEDKDEAPLEEAQPADIKEEEAQETAAVARRPASSIVSASKDTE